MKNKKSYIFTLAALVFFIICLPSVASANEEVSSDEIDSIINELIDDVNSQLEEGKHTLSHLQLFPVLMRLWKLL